MNHYLRRCVTVPTDIDTVFQFFSSAHNLDMITPNELRFKILTPGSIDMQTGTLIDYSIRLYGVKIKWKTRISVWQPTSHFIDTQIRGPFAKWEHTHSFESTDEGTLIRDEVCYRLPLFPFGEIVYPLVRFQLSKIFNYRSTMIQSFFHSLG